MAVRPMYLTVYNDLKPVELGQIVFKNVAGTGINIVATKSVRSSK